MWIILTSDFNKLKVKMHQVLQNGSGETQKYKRLYITRVFFTRKISMIRIHCLQYFNGDTTVTENQVLFYLLIKLCFKKVK